MSATYQPSLDFEAAEFAAEDGDALVIDVDGFEGPLHLLLALLQLLLLPKSRTAL